MNHSFTPSQIDSTKCNLCKRGVIDHTDMATCECCSNIGKMEVFMTMLMCPECVAKEKALQIERKNGEDTRVSSLLERAKTIDYSIQVKEDIFNAETISIAEIKKAIDEDGNIPNKTYTLAESVLDRINHFQTVIFEKQAEITEEGNKQRAAQSYLNQLVSQLRIEEREKLKLKDLSYKPTETKTKVKKIETKKGFDKHELVKWANSVDIPLAAFQMVCVAKNMNPEQAAEHFKKIKGMN